MQALVPSRRFWRELERLRDELHQRARGRTLDLVEGLGLAELEHSLARGDVYDTIVSVMAMPRFPDLDDALAQVRGLLHPDGQLLLLEPDQQYRWMDRALGLMAPLLAATRGMELDRAVASAVRGAGFTITDLERKTMPTLVWPLRSFICARAMVDPGEGGGTGR